MTQVDTASVSLTEFCDRLFAGRGSNSGRIWDHMLSWWPHRRDTNVLWLTYEDLQRDTRACVTAVAEFMEIDYNEELIDTVERQVNQSGV